MAIQPGHYHAKNAFPIEILSKLRARQAKRVVKRSFHVLKPGNIGEPIRSEENSGFVFCPQVYESKFRSLGFDLGAFLGQLGDRLAAKCSAEMPQKNQ
jgi:hypothetical protein